MTNMTITLKDQTKADISTIFNNDEVISLLLGFTLGANALPNVATDEFVEKYTNVSKLSEIDQNVKVKFNLFKQEMSLMTYNKIVNEVLVLTIIMNTKGFNYKEDKDYILNELSKLGQTQKFCLEQAFKIKMAQMFKRYFLQQVGK